MYPDDLSFVYQLLTGLGLLMFGMVALFLLASIAFEVGLHVIETILVCIVFVLMATLGIPLLAAVKFRAWRRGVPVIPATKRPE